MKRWWRQPPMLVAALGVLAVIMTVLLSQPTLIQSTTGAGSPVIGKAGRDVIISPPIETPSPPGQSAPPAPSTPSQIMPKSPEPSWWPPIVVGLIAAGATIIAAYIQHSKAAPPANAMPRRRRRKS